MKKKVAALIVIAFLGSSSIHAANWSRIGGGLGALGAGTLLMVTPSLFKWDKELSTVAYVSGGVCLLAGLIGVIWGALEEDNAYAKINSDSVLKYVKFDATADSITLSFKTQF